jgi:uncharacterized lipoprotein
MYGMSNKTKQLTKQEYRIVLDAYMKQSEISEMDDIGHQIYIEIRNKLIALGEAEIK